MSEEKNGMNADQKAANEEQKKPAMLIIPGGLTQKEHDSIMYLAHAWESFMELPEMGIQAKTDFAQGLHAAQRVIGMRVLARAYPKFWKGG